MLTGGQIADYAAGELLLEQMPPASMLPGDKGYDSNAIRRQVEGNAIEGTFCRLKDFQRIATRYDRLASNYLAAVCLAAAVSYWL